LTRGGVFISVTTVLAHLLFELKLLLLGLKLQLNCMLSLTLVHLGFKLFGLAALFFSNLSLLNFKFSEERVMQTRSYL
jgi:hypothetical protein